MNFFEAMWAKLKRSKKYREEFVAASVRRSFPMQVRAIMKKRDISQAELARDSRLTQGAISRASDLDYGRLTLHTIIRVAAGLDMAVIIRLIPFSRLVRDYDKTPERELAAVKTFAEEDTLESVELETLTANTAMSERVRTVTTDRQLKASLSGNSAEIESTVASRNAGNLYAEVG